jgi:putative ABC transport system permease protein
MTGMWRNYLTVGIRSLVKNPTYAFITVFGLAIGMAACLMILLFLRYETSYDRWIPGAANIYQVQSWYRSSETGQTDRLQMTAHVAGKALKQDFPAIEKQVYVLSVPPVLLKDGQPSMLDEFKYVDGNLLDVIPLPLVRGDRRTLDRPGNALITQAEARKYFGTEDVVGRTMALISKGTTYQFRIGGVLKDLPKNSHLRISGLGRMDFDAFFAEEKQFFTCWGCLNGWLYLRLKPGTDPRSIERRLPAWEKKHIPDELSGEARFNAGDDQDWHLVNIRDVHLGRAQAAAMTPGNDRGTILTFAIIAVLILAMAVVNFTNLATARASQRAREVALRKVLGGTRRNLVIQFVGESVVIAAIAMLVALAIVELLMPSLAAFVGAEARLAYVGEQGVLLPVIGLVLVVGVLGGLYPAFHLSRFQPASVLKANQSAADPPGSGRLRNMLVVGQFAISIALIICTVVVYLQTAYARTADPGYQRDQILQVDGMNRAQLIDLGNLIAAEVGKVPGVEAVGRSEIGVGTDEFSTTGVMVPGVPKPLMIGFYRVDESLIDAMGLQLIAGRWFRPNEPMDDMTLDFPIETAPQRALVERGGHIVINELAAKRLGFEDPADAVGARVRAALVDNKLGLVPVTVIGVAKDSRFRSVRLPVEPMMYANADKAHQFLIVRYRGDPEAVRKGVEQVWRRIATDVPFEARFSDEIVSELYAADDARAKTFAAFAALAIIVACLGLFGLAAFTAERRTKEIGIRKVLGARTLDVVRLLAWQFSKPVILANLIAWPAAWWVMRDWLDGFDAHIELGPVPFVAAGSIALAIAIGTIAGHALKVARANPIHALRYE